MKIGTNNPMQPENLARAPRCGARTRAGLPCMSPAVRGRRRCRMHGGTSPGAPKGNRNAWRSGDRSAEAQTQLKVVRATNRKLKLLAKLISGSPLRPGEQDLLIQLLIDAGHLGSAICDSQDNLVEAGLSPR